MVSDYVAQLWQNCHKPHFTDALLGDAKAQNSSPRSASADPGCGKVDGDLRPAGDFQEHDLSGRIKKPPAAWRQAVLFAAVTATRRSWCPC
jgi:hypothetical protein